MAQSLKGRLTTKNVREGGKGQVLQNPSTRELDGTGLGKESKQSIQQAHEPSIG